MATKKKKMQPWEELYLVLDNYETILPNEEEALKRIKELVDQGVDYTLRSPGSVRGGSPLHLASEIADTRPLKIFLNAMKDVKDINLSDFHGNTPMHWAAIQGRYTTIELLAKKADELQAGVPAGKKVNVVNTINNHTWTPLHSAAYKAQSEAIVTLLRFDADPTKKTSIGETPLDMGSYSQELVEVIQNATKKQRARLMKKKVKEAIRERGNSESLSL